MENQTQGLRQLPQYRSHKVVGALKIADIKIDWEPVKEPKGAFLEEDPRISAPSGATITPAEEGFAPFKVGREYVRKHKPLIGGYYVVYASGYESWSPAKEFEEGYTKIEG